MEHEDTTSVALVPLPTLETLDYESLPMGEWAVRTIETDAGPRTYRFYRTIFGTFSAVYHPLLQVKEEPCRHEQEHAQRASI